MIRPIALVLCVGVAASAGVAGPSGAAAAAADFGNPMLDMRCPKAPVVLFDDVRFELFYGNPAASSATAAQIVDTLPEGLDFVRSEPDGCQVTGRTVTCDVDVPNGDAARLVIVVHVVKEKRLTNEITLVPTEDTNRGVSASCTFTPAVDIASMDFTTTGSAAVCGRVTNDILGLGDSVAQLACGALNLGGGSQGVATPIPDGATTRFCVSGCETDGQCTLAASDDRDAFHECSNTGCSFGPPLPVIIGPYRSCVVNTLAGPASGSINRFAGRMNDLNIPLRSAVFDTGNVMQPCPLCRQQTVSGPPCAGKATNPCGGFCDRGANRGKTCSSTNAQGLSADCPPGGTEGPDYPCLAGSAPANLCADGSRNLGSIPVNLGPLSTDGALLSSANGLFCSGQVNENAGCFGVGASESGSLCRSVVVTGQSPGDLPQEMGQPAKLAATFCIDSTGSADLDSALGLPGPGAIAIVGTLQLGRDKATCAELGSTTTSSTSTTTLPNRCGDGALDAGETCDLGRSRNGAANSCCTSTCQLVSSGVACGDAPSTTCLPRATCTGRDAECPTSSPAPPDTGCVSTNPCTLGDHCQGGECVPGNTSVCDASIVSITPKIKIQCTGTPVPVRSRWGCDAVGVAKGSDVPTTLLAPSKSGKPPVCALNAGGDVDYCRAAKKLLKGYGTIVIECKPTRCAQALKKGKGKGKLRAQAVAPPPLDFTVTLDRVQTTTATRQAVLEVHQ